MRPAPWLFCSLLALAAPAAAGEAAKFEVVARRVVSSTQYVPYTPAARVSVPLSLIVESGSDWTKPVVLEETLGKASRIFARCGLTLADAEVLEVRWSQQALQELADPNPYFGPSQLHVMDEPLLPKRRPLAFLFSNSVPATAKAFNLDSVAAYQHAGHPEVAKLLNTTWLTTRWQEGGQDSSALAPSFSVLAHELAHLFGNLEHVPWSPNLMSSAETPGAQSGDLADGQCSEILKLYGL